MRRDVALSIVALALAFGAPAFAQTRLSDQNVLGWKRICTYEEVRPPPAGVRAPRNYVMEIGRAEPCPPRYSPPAPARPVRPAPHPARPGMH